MSGEPQAIPVGEEPTPLNPPKDRPRPTPQEAAPRPTGKGGSGRWAVLNDFVDVTMRSLSRAEIAVWFVLYRDTKKNGIARAGQMDIGRRAGMSDRTVRRAISKLKRHGLLTILHRGSLGKGPSVYRVHPLPADD